MSTCNSAELKRLNYLIGETDAVYHEISLKLGLSDSVSKILYVICDNGGSCLLQDICRGFGISKQTVNSAVRKLEREGVVYLEYADGKSKNVLLTDFGKQFAAKTAAHIIEMENAVFASWPREDVETYLKLTERFLLDLKSQAENLQEIKGKG